MKIRMRTIYAGPTGTASPGQVVELADPAAKALIAGGFAVAVDAPAVPERVAPIETATAEPVAETAVTVKPKKASKPKKPTKAKKPR